VRTLVWRERERERVAAFVAFFDFERVLIS
jgi:hypothetical protein